MADRDELMRAALRDGAPAGLDSQELAGWYEARAWWYGEAAAEDPDGDSEAGEVAWNARARARALRRGRAW